MIRVIICKPGEPPESKMISPTVFSIRDTVGGWFEAINIGDQQILYCKDHANDSKYNRTVRGHPIRGTFLITKMTGDLKEEEVQTLLVELMRLDKPEFS